MKREILVGGMLITISVSSIECSVPITVGNMFTANPHGLKRFCEIILIHWTFINNCITLFKMPLLRKAHLFNQTSNSMDGFIVTKTSFFRKERDYKKDLVY